MNTEGPEVITNRDWSDGPVDDKGFQILDGRTFGVSLHA